MLLISIKPRFAQAIFSGAKIAECRRQLPLRGAPFFALVYESVPTQRITGILTISNIVKSDGEDISEIIGDRDPYKDIYAPYLNGAKRGGFLLIKNAQRFSCPISLHEMHDGPKRPPQSYCYLSQEAFNSTILSQG